MVEAGVLQGIVSDRDLRDVSPSVLLDHHSQILVKTTIKHIMKSEVVVVHPLDYVVEAAKLMYNHRIGCLPVLSDGQLVGIITETDLMRALIELTGSTEPGSTLEVLVPERYGPLAEITKIVKDNKVSIASCYIRPDRSLDHRRIVIRVKTIDPSKIIQGIQAAGYQVIRPLLGGNGSE